MDSEYIMTADGELYHWGIKGMRWGVRRYQTKDGSLTPAGKKRYDKDMAKVKAETKRLKNQQRTDAKLSKLEAAKNNLKALKNKSKGKVDDSENKEAAETDEQKRERILKAPTAKDVYENRHLFSNKEVGDLYLRLNNEQNIKNLVPKEVDAGKARTEKFFSDLDKATTNITKLAKAYNTVANIYNAFGGSAVSLPKIDLDNTKGNRETRRQEKKKYNEELKKREKEAADEAAAERAAKAEKKAEKKAAKEEKKAAKEAAKEEKKAAKEEKKANKEAEKEAEREAMGRGEANRKARDTFYENVTFDGDVVDGPSKSQTSSGKSKKTSSVVDADSWERVYDTAIAAVGSSSERQTSGKTFVSGYLDTPVRNLPSGNIAGYLPAPKDDD